MQILRSVFNVGLGAIGGVLGNLVAAWIQQDAWGNLFTPARLLGTLAGFVLIILALAWLDVAATTRSERTVRTPTGIRGNVQIGNPLIRVLRGTNVYRNVQVGSGRIEVVDDSPETDKDSP